MEIIRVLYLGDLVGTPGLRALFVGLNNLVDDTGADLVAVNGENLAGGYGLTVEDVRTLFDMGVAVISTGNHIWQRDEIHGLLDSEKRLLRPENYPAGVPGHGTCILEAAGTGVGFLNLQGRERMGSAIECPFRVASRAVARLKESVSCIVVDFHAEDTREKEALAFHLDGRVSAVVGSHTHVQTTDERVTEAGTAVITDMGMCGPLGSVIGTRPELSVRRSLTQLPLKMEVHEAPASIQGVLIEIEKSSGRARSILRFERRPRSD